METRMETLPAAIAEAEGLDRFVHPVLRLADRLVADPRVGDVLRGTWLGHPLHPMLTDLPVGFWTSAFVLDLGGRRFHGAADAMVAAGVLSALPTAAAGLADWRERDTADRRVGVVHAAANAAATLLYVGSLGHRLRGHRVRGVLLGMAGAAAATAGGYLGGHLAFGSAPAAESDAPATESPAAAVGAVDQQGAALAAMAQGA